MALSLVLVSVFYCMTPHQVTYKGQSKTEVGDSNSLPPAATSAWSSLSLSPSLPPAAQGRGETWVARRAAAAARQIGIRSLSLACFSQCLLTLSRVQTQRALRTHIQNAIYKCIFAPNPPKLDLANSNGWPSGYKLPYLASVKVVRCTELCVKKLQFC